MTATAHKLARQVYRVLKYGRDYVKQSMADYETKTKEMLARQLKAKAAKLGFELLPKATATS